MYGEGSLPMRGRPAPEDKKFKDLAPPQSNPLRSEAIKEKGLPLSGYPFIKLASLKKGFELEPTDAS